MSRPRKCSRADSMPGMTFFKPRGIPMQDLTEVYLPLEGLEAMRLVDLDGLKHKEAAEKMNVSRQTFGRILSQARSTVTDTLVHSYALRIQGEAYIVAEQELQATRSGLAGGDVSSPVRKQASKETIEKETKSEEMKMEKIAVTAESPNLDDVVDPRFGRAAGFLIVNPETMACEYLDNGVSQAMAQGAGIQAAEIVANSGAKVVLTGYVGPKAFQALQAAGIKVAQNLMNLTVREALAQYASGKAEIAAQPNRMGHGR